MRWRGVSEDFDRRLADLRTEQEVKRTAAEQLGAFQDAKALRRAKHLAHRWFGDSGMLQIEQTKPGIVQVGWYVDPPAKYPGLQRRRVIAFEGASVAELEEQHRLWRSRQA